jgi:hypothetical protein
MISPNLITFLAAHERLASLRERDDAPRRLRPARRARRRRGAGLVLSVAAGLLVGLVTAAGAAAHDVTLTFDVRTASERVSKGTVSGAIKGTVRAEALGKRALARGGGQVRLEWKVRAGAQSFTAVLRGSVNRRTKRAVLDGRIASGHLKGAEVRLRGRLLNRRSGRIVGKLTIAPHAARASARAAETCADPCAFVAVVRHGDGRVIDERGLLDCGTNCTNLLSGVSGEAVLVATGAFHAWKDCPAPAGNRCTIPLDGNSRCIHAFFTADANAPPTAGSCPVASPAPPTRPGDAVAPQTRITAGPSGRTSTRAALFRFAANEPRISFRCKLDGGAWRRCGSPKRLRGLRPGRHVFRVAAVDAAGNRDLTPAVRRWRVAR